MKKAALVLLVAALSLPALADDALGTLTVKGKTTVLKAVAATEETGEGGQKWLVILASDRKVEGDHSIARLAQLANDGKLHAVRILWRIGSDTVRAVPYDAKLPTSGQMGQESPTLDLRKYGSGRVDAEFKSKMLGQDWHFHANVKAKVVPGGTLEYEHEAQSSVRRPRAATRSSRSESSATNTRRSRFTTRSRTGTSRPCASSSRSGCRRTRMRRATTTR